MEFNATFIVAFISFIIFTVVMNIILYQPINDIVAKRKKHIDDNYEEAKNNADKTEAIYQKRLDKLDKARTEAKALVAEKTKHANEKKDEKTSDAQQEANKFIDATRIYYNNATEKAKDYFKLEVMHLAQAISDKFLDKEELINEVDKDIVEDIMQG